MGACVPALGSEPIPGGTRTTDVTPATGSESGDALLSNTDRMRAAFGEPEVGVDHMIEHVAGCVESGGAVLDKPTHFETRDGQF